MKTKTLLITAAAALAAGIMSSQAQVYSQNIVGYVNIPETAGGFSLESLPLDADGTQTNDTFASVFPAPTLGDNVYLFNLNSGQYDLYQYTTKNVSHVSTTAWFAPSGSIANTNKIYPGQAYFYNAAANETNTYVGSVLSGALTNNFVPAANGFSLVSSLVPIGGGLTSVLNYQPNVGDNVYLFNVTSGQYDLYQYTTKNVSHVPTTAWFNPSGVASEPVINVGQGFWLNPAATTTWSQTFTNN
jgi:hypothetical protein